MYERLVGVRMWYTEYLLLNRRDIKAKADIESDEFNDLLLVEKELNKLVKENIVTEEEFRILNLILDSGSLNELEGSGNSSNEKLSRIFTEVCDRLSFMLGDVFTNEGYANYLVEKYELSQWDVEVILEYMESKYRHSILRNKFKSKKGK
jgi:hypothetical protein